MATYYIRIWSSWQGDRKRACHKTDDKDFAARLAHGLEVGEHEYGRDNPGIGGARHAEFVSKTKLQRAEGIGAITQAEADLEYGWDDPPVRPRLRHPKEGRTPYPLHTWERVMADVRTIEEAYEEEREGLETEDAIPFLIRELPAPLHQKINGRYKRDGYPSMTAWIVAALTRAAEQD